VLLPQFLLGAAALEQVLDRLEPLVGDRDQVVGADEDVELSCVQAPDRAIEDREVQDDEQVVGVLVDLRALVARQDVLEVEGMEPELLLEPSTLERRGALDVDPAQPLGGDRLDLGLALLWLRRGRDEMAGPGQPSQPWLREVRHRLTSRSVARPSRPQLRLRDGGERPATDAATDPPVGIVLGHITTTSRGVEGLAR
jgi:hypothetical protein